MSVIAVHDRRSDVVPAARARRVVKVYGSGVTEVRALDEVTLDLPRARFTAIMGPSGSGKSTLLHCLAGLDEVTSGEVFVGDVDVTALDEKRRTLLRRDRLGFIFQFFNLVPSLTALENIMLPMSLARREPDRAWVDELVGTMGLQERLHHRPSELSGGEQQRVAAARTPSTARMSSSNCPGTPREVKLPADPKPLSART